MRSPVRLGLLLGLLFLLGSGMVIVRGQLLQERSRLGWRPTSVAGLPEGESAGLGSPSPLLLGTAATGVFRAVAIDYLWVRAARLQEEGNFFESGALANLITVLQPRLTTVWAFQAQNLAYNVTAALPVRDRYTWVLDAIRLLRDRGLRLNPRDPELLLELSFIFLHKIGADYDDAGYLYRSELARTFEVDQGSAGGARVRAAWGIQEGELAPVEAEWGVDLDFRAAESHALYWAELGRRNREGLRRKPRREHALYVTARAALFQLLAGGRPVRAPQGARYAFVPDLQFADPCQRMVDLDRERLRGRADTLAALDYLEARFHGQRIYYSFLYGRVDEARELLRRTRERVSPSSETIEEFVVSHVEFMTGDVAALPPSPRPWEAHAVSLLDAFLLLRLAGEDELASGFLEVARLVVARRPEQVEPGSADRTLEALLRTVARRRLAPWQELPGFWGSVPAALRDLAGEPGAESLPDVPRVAELPFRLELIDPLWRPEE